MKIEGNIICIKELPKHWSFRIYANKEFGQIWVNSFDKKPDEIKEGVDVVAEVEKNDKGFWNLKKIDKKYAMVVKEEHGVAPSNQLQIIRQSSLRSACQLVNGTNANPDMVKNIADDFVKWVLRPE